MAKRRLGSPDSVSPAATAHDATSLPPRCLLFFRQLTLMCLLGALTVFGLPGVGFFPVYLASLVLLLRGVLSAPALGTALPMALAWSVGLFGSIAAGSVSWGVEVPILVAGGFSLAYGLPAAIVGRLLGSRTSGLRLFLVAFLSWSLWQTLLDRLGFLPRDAVVLVGATPLAAAVRLSGSSIAGGLLFAASLVAARVTLTPPPSGGPSGLWARTSARTILGVLCPFGLSAVVLLALSGIASLTAEPATGQLWVGVPQMSGASEFYRTRQLRPAAVREFEAALWEELGRLSDVELLVFTEEFDGRFHLLAAPTVERWRTLGLQRHQALIVSTAHLDERGLRTNSLLGVGRAGELAGVRHKVALAPFGESALGAGRTYAPFTLAPALSAGALVCLESILPEAVFTMVRGGANLLTVSTSDISFGASPLVFYHVALTGLKALESGRDVVWASNGGPSGVIDRWGDLQAATVLHERSVLRARASTYTQPAFYCRFEPFIVAALVYAWAASMFMLLRRRHEAAGPPHSNARAQSGVGRPLALALAAVVATVFAFAAAPFCIEAENGRVARARESMLATFGFRSSPAPEPHPYARFRGQGDKRGAGAIAFWLAQYGVDVAVDALGVPASMAEAADLLARGLSMSTRRLPLAHETRLANPALVELAGDGLAVAVGELGDQVLVFLPEAAAVIPVPRPLFLQRAGRERLLPRGAIVSGLEWP